MPQIQNVYTLGGPEWSTPNHGDVIQGNVMEAPVVDVMGGSRKRGGGFPGLWVAPDHVVFV